LENFDHISSNDILEVLNQIQNQFQNQITQYYLKGKIKAISDTFDEAEKKKLCKNLKPYLDWYLQGI
jgi:ATP-dependent Lon protease